MIHFLQVARLDFGQSAAYRDFFEHVDLSGGIYRHRWGADPIVFLLVTMLLEEGDVVHFDDVPYLHQHLVANLPASLAAPLSEEDAGVATDGQGTQGTQSTQNMARAEGAEGAEGMAAVEAVVVGAAGGVGAPVDVEAELSSGRMASRMAGRGAGRVVNGVGHRATDGHAESLPTRPANGPVAPEGGPTGAEPVGSVGGAAVGTARGAASGAATDAVLFVTGAAHVAAATFALGRWTTPTGCGRLRLHVCADVDAMTPTGGARDKGREGRVRRGRAPGRGG